MRNQALISDVLRDRFSFRRLHLLSTSLQFVQIRTYGELFREGDTVSVALNMDLGTLAFARNGRDLGVAVQDLEGTLYPAFSLYNRCDSSNSHVATVSGRCPDTRVREVQW